MEATITKSHFRLFSFFKSTVAKWCISFLLFLPLIFNAQKSHATHMMGADITYRCIDTLKFEITLKWYRDCRGIQLNGAGGHTIRCTSGPDQNKGFKATISGEKAMELIIFNRWGEIMFITNDVNEKWDGTFKGEPAQQDVYAYQLNVTALNDEVYNYTGTITLIR